MYRGRDSGTSGLSVPNLHITLPICLVIVGISSVEKFDPEYWELAFEFRFYHVHEPTDSVALSMGEYYNSTPRCTEVGVKTDGSMRVK